MENFIGNKAAVYQFTQWLKKPKCCLIYGPYGIDLLLQKYNYNKILIYSDSDIKPLINQKHRLTILLKTLLLFTILILGPFL